MHRGILVGLGGRGHSWIEVCRRNPEVELTGFVEPVESQRARAVASWQVPADRIFGTLAEAIRAAQAEFVLDVTPPAIHARVATEAFASGLHFLGEKPLSDDWDAACRVVAAAKAAGRTHMVAQNYRFAALPRTTRRVLTASPIGNPEVVSVGFYREWAHAPGTHYTTMPYPLLTDMGIHHFDLLRYVLGREPESVFALSWNPSWGWHAGDAGHATVIRFSGGLVATHHSLGASVGKQSPWNGEWRIEGPGGSLTWEDDQLWRTTVSPRADAAREQVPLDRLPASGQDAVLAEFISALEAGREPECSGRDNLRSLALVFAAVRSAREHREVQLAELLDQTGI